MSCPPPTARASLRLAAALDAVPPLPRGDVLLQTHPRRPGDRHEVVVVPHEARLPLAELAAVAGLATDVVGTVMLEANDLVRVVAEAAGEPATGHLDQAAASARVRRALTAAEAAYLRALTWAPESRVAPPPPQTIALPVRLLSRVRETAWPSTSAAEPLARVIAWEAAALVAGRTLTEWGLECVLRATPS